MPLGPEEEANPLAPPGGAPYLPTPAPSPGPPDTRGPGGDTYTAPPPTNAPPTPAPAPPAKPVDDTVLGPFAGVGIFTSNLPTAALAGAGHAQWVALLAGTADPRDADTLRAAGFRIIVWEVGASLGQAAVDQYGAEGYIAQDEGPGQLAAALALGPSIKVPKALISNLHASTWPVGWVCLPEAYQNANPNATPQGMVYGAGQRLAVAIAPVLGVYDASSEGGGVVTLAEYLPEVRASSANSYSIFAAESAPPEVWATLAGQATSSPALPPATPTNTPINSPIAPNPTVQAYCFAWGGSKWGRQYPGVNAFVTYLRAHGTDPLTWGYNHPSAADCIGLDNYVLVNSSAFPLSPEQRTALIEGGFSGVTVSSPQVEPTPQPAPTPPTTTAPPTTTTTTPPQAPQVPAPLPAASWQALVCKKGGWPQSAINEYALSLWADSEGMSTFANNPLAATDHLPGSTPYPPSPIVQVYISLDQAAQLYVNKFNSSTYGDIGTALAQGDDLEAIYIAVNDSPWCGGCQGGHYPVDLYNAVYGSVAPPKSAPPVQPPVVVQGTTTAAAASSWRSLLAVFSTARPAAQKTVSALGKGLLARVK